MATLSTTSTNPSTSIEAQSKPAPKTGPATDQANLSSNSLPALAPTELDALLHKPATGVTSNTGFKLPDSDNPTPPQSVGGSR
jgi:hypothetical protein